MTIGEAHRSSLPQPARASRIPGLTTQILAGLVLGAVVGALWPQAGVAVKPLADAFLRLIKMIIAPLVFSTLVAGVAGTGDIKAMGRIGLKATVYFEFATTIVRLGHEARPTTPYSDDTWSELLAAGDRTDAALTAAGLHVWIGGEPTFVAREGQTRKEWQGGALGADKWQRGRKLAELLRAQLAPAGCVLHRMGKH